MTFFRSSMMIFTFCIMTPILVTAKNLHSDYPPILDFYPNCSYKVLKQHSVKGKMKDIYAMKKMTSKLLLRLRKQADDIGADAVIIVDHKVKRSELAVKGVTFTVTYNTELIKKCRDNQSDTKKRTPYDHLGKKTRTAFTNIMLIKESSFKVSPKKTIHRPEIANQEVSLEKGLYGIKLGTTYQQVLTAFGKPNSELRLYSDEKVIGYGRRHWLHFQSEKLVKIQTESPLLSQETVNKIPFLDFFDDYRWEINSKITYKSKWSDIKELFNFKERLNKQHQLIIKNDSETLILQFNKYQGEKQSETYYALDGFTLQSNTYKKPSHKLVINKANHFDVVNNIFQIVNEKQTLESNLIKSQLGKPLGSILLSAQERLFIFNNNLLLNIKDEKILAVSLTEQVFIADIESNQPWHLGPFIQGYSVDLLRQYFPADIVELDGIIKIDTEEFQLSMYFDEVNNNSLYEAQMTLYY